VTTAAIGAGIGALTDLSMRKRITIIAARTPGRSLRKGVANLAAKATDARDASACYRELRTSLSRTTTDPLRLVSFTSEPPPAMEPVTLRLDTEPCTEAPMIVTDPDPLLASSVNGTEDSVTMSTLPEPVETTQSRRGMP
jgi:hypothetical protein